MSMCGGAISEAHNRDLRRCLGIASVVSSVALGFQHLLCVSIAWEICQKKSRPILARTVWLMLGLTETTIVFSYFCCWSACHCYLFWLVAGLPRYTNGKGQIPNCEYWFAQERRHLTESFLISHACWLGCLTVAVVYGIHISILRANAITPPVLATDRLITMVVVYLCGLVWWTAAFLRHFQSSLGK